MNFEEIIRALNDIGYQGPLSVEWEDSGMDRLSGWYKRRAQTLAFIVGVAVAEVSTGEFRVGEVAAEELPTLLLEYPAREVLLPGPRRGPVLASA